MSGINGYAQRGDVSKKIHKEQQEITTTLSALTSEQLGGIEEIYKTHESNVLNAFSSAHTFKLLKVIDKARHAGHGTSVNKLLWTGHEELLISAGDDRAISVWDLEFNS